MVGSLETSKKVIKMVQNIQVQVDSSVCTWRGAILLGSRPSARLRGRLWSLWQMIPIKVGTTLLPLDWLLNFVMQRSGPWYTTKPIELCCAWVGRASAVDLRAVLLTSLTPFDPFTLDQGVAAGWGPYSLFRTLFFHDLQKLGRPVAIHTHCNWKVVWLSGPCKSSDGCKPFPAEMVRTDEIPGVHHLSEWIMSLAPSLAWKHYHTDQFALIKTEHLGMKQQLFTCLEGRNVEFLKKKTLLVSASTVKQVVVKSQTARQF